jgi:hypothetical protein
VPHDARVLPGTPGMVLSLLTADVEATMVALRGLLDGHHSRLEAESMVGHRWAFRVRFSEGVT